MGRRPDTHIAFNPAVPDDAYFPSPSFWRSSQLPGHPPIDTSGIIQPPVHAIAARAVMARLGVAGNDFGSRAYPALVAQRLLSPRSAKRQWARSSRAPMGDGP